MFRTLKVFGRLALASGAVALLATAAQASGDAKAGAGVYQRCAVCHSNAKDAPNKIGPNLFGVVGRKAGSYAGYNYSPAMKNSGITWTEEKLEAYIEHPQQVVAGNKMPFGGISDHKQTEDLAAYLASLK
ncbi:MAG: cytochrome c family protein [Paracoccaceae bacterium]|nr:cytochrome c family protein [Paracoccaceae bacterium]